MQDVYNEAQELNKTEADKLLKSYGLRDVEVSSIDFQRITTHPSVDSLQNVFWLMRKSDLHRALSWCRLHAYHSGLFSDHLLPEFKLIVEELGRSAAVDIDQRSVLFLTQLCVSLLKLFILW